jgi:tetratricopeptide (TPR) repeat protein
LRVPLILHQPGVLPAGRLVRHPMGGVDLMPTLLDLLGIAAPAPAHLRGMSFAAAALGTGPAPATTLYSETLMPLLHFGWSELRALRTGSYKLILAPRPELYQLREDPQEQTNLIGKAPAPARELRQRLEALVAQDQPRQGAALELDEETLAKLAALGYAGAPAPLPASGPLPDPKDKIDQFRRYNELIREGILAVGDGKHAQAERALRQLLEAGNPSFEVHYYLGKALLAQKRYGEAGEQLEAAIAILPHVITPYLECAEAALGAGDSALAVRTLQRALDRDPKAYPAWARLARIREEQGDHASAETAWSKARELRPNDPILLAEIASFYRETGRPEQAIQALEQALSAAPTDAELHNQLGMLRGGAGELEPAIESFRKAVELKPKEPKYLFNLAEAQRRSGDLSSAARGFRKVLELDASFTEARTKLAELGNSSAAATSPQLHLRLIQVPGLQAAETLRRRIEAGEDFAELATKYSQHPSRSRGGDLGAVRFADLKPELRAAAEQLTPGATSPPIPSAGSYILLQRLR